MSYYLENTRFNRKALSQVYGILCDYDEEDLKKIPLKIRKLIEDNRDIEYDFTVDDIEENNANLLKETKQILTYLYTNFLSTLEEKNILRKLEYIQYQNKRKNDEIKFNNIVTKTINEQNIYQKDENNNEMQQMIEYKENIFKKFLKAVKKFFKRKK